MFSGRSFHEIMSVADYCDGALKYGRMYVTRGRGSKKNGHLYKNDQVFQQKVKTKGRGPKHCQKIQTYCIGGPS